MWALFAIVVIATMALDLGVFHRKAHVVSVKEASIWSAVWIALSLAFNAVVAWRLGREAGQAFLTGYLIEKALSVDNLFVFYMIFAAFRIPDANQHRLLFWGIIGALVLRTGMVFGGSYLLGRFQFLAYLFGGLLAVTGVKMLARPDKEPHPERGRLFKLLTRIIPTTEDPHGTHFFVRQGQHDAGQHDDGQHEGATKGALRATPLLVVLLLIELSDIVFAIDSILAIFAITQDPFIVLTSNLFAVMGMRSLYFVLAGLARSFVYLQPGLALVLLFVGVKMAIGAWVHIPVLLSLAVVSALLGGSIVASLLQRRRQRRRTQRRDRHASAEA